MSQSSAAGYNNFSYYYDRLTKNVNYRGYAEKIDGYIKKYNPYAESMVDLACGTFTLGLKLSDFGYKLIGIDSSEKMLYCAKSKAALYNTAFDFYNEDISSFKLPKPADVFICTLDSLNHLKGFGKVLDVFRSVKKNISRGGLFIFDMNTPYKHRCVLGDNSYIYSLRNLYCGWQNEYRDVDRSVRITIDIFASENGAYKHFSESFR